MATPLAPFINARIEFLAAGGRGGPEVGFRELPGQKYLVTAFLRQDTAKWRSPYVNNIDQKAAEDYWVGYIVGFVPLPDLSNYETYPYEGDPNYDDSGKRPPGFVGPEEIELTIGSSKFNSAQLLNTHGKYGDLGIGGIIRDVIGDRLIIKTERW